MFDLIKRDNKINDYSLANIFDDFFKPNFSNFFDSGWSEDENGNPTFEIEVPGFNADNLKVEVENGIISVQGKTDKRQIYKRYQIGNIDNVDATLKDGILTLTIKRKEQDIKKIELKS